MFLMNSAEQSRKCNHGRAVMRVAGIAPRQAVSLGLIVISSNEPLRATSGGWQHVMRPSQIGLNRG
jgi:hypothetical protein